MKRFFNILNKSETYIVTISLTLLLIISFLQVFSRMVLNAPLAWTEEASRYLFIFNVLFSSVIVTRRDENFKVDFVYDKLNDKTKKIFDLISILIVIAFSIVLVVFGFDLVNTGSGRVSPSLGLPMSVVYMPIPLTGILNIVHVLEKISNKRSEN